MTVAATSRKSRHHQRHAITRYAAAERAEATGRGIHRSGSRCLQGGAYCGRSGGSTDRHPYDGQVAVHLAPRAIHQTGSCGPRQLAERRSLSTERLSRPRGKGDITNIGCQSSVHNADRMARTARASVGGMWYHVTNRGNRREAVSTNPVTTMPSSSSSSTPAPGFPWISSGTA
jgi:hypothetical protein